MLRGASSHKVLEHALGTRWAAGAAGPPGAGLLRRHDGSPRRRRAPSCRCGSRPTPSAWPRRRAAWRSDSWNLPGRRAATASSRRATSRSLRLPARQYAAVELRGRDGLAARPHRPPGPAPDGTQAVVWDYKGRGSAGQGVVTAGERWVRQRLPGCRTRSTCSRRPACRRWSSSVGSTSRCRAKTPPPARPDRRRRSRPGLRSRHDRVAPTSRAAALELCARGRHSTPRRDPRRTARRPARRRAPGLSGGCYTRRSAGARR